MGVSVGIKGSAGGCSRTALGAFRAGESGADFKSLNGRRPRFYRDADFGGVSWRWPAGAWVANVRTPGDDSFAAVEDDP